MVLVLQESPPIANANAYVLRDWVIDYHAQRGKAVASNEDLDTAIIRATDYVDQRFNFIGHPVNLDQTTAWPRCEAVNEHGYLIINIPLAVRRAVAEYAVIALDAELNPTPERDESGRSVIFKEEVVGPISESARYSKSGSFSMPSYPRADAFIAKAGLISGTTRIVRG